MNIREKALAFATEKHKGQKRWKGEDYITHPIQVARIAMEIFEEEYASDYEKFDLDNLRDEIYVTAILHDVLEDTDTSYEELIAEFGEDITSNVNLLSKKEGQSYLDFILGTMNFMSNFTPRIVKRADIRHNLLDIKKGSMKDKYELALHILGD